MLLIAFLLMLVTMLVSLIQGSKMRSPREYRALVSATA